MQHDVVDHLLNNEEDIYRGLSEEDDAYDVSKQDDAYYDEYLAEEEKYFQDLCEWHLTHVPFRI